ncbi:MAG TPA: helix-turn-helix transcriptional regulator [Chloroflexota bacterium]|nr:helix-turn-helix transcriptional regulator [Chloroflexota bacterium]
MPKDQATNLGERVRKRRRALGLTAKALAKAAGVSTSYISQVERGHQKDPSLPAVRRLADALSMDMHALLGAPAPASDPPQVPAPLRQLAEEYHLPSDQVSMLAMINIDGHQPGNREDWLFLLLAIRRSCRILEPLSVPVMAADKGDKHAV